MCTHYGGWGGYLTFAPRRWNNWHNEMEVLAKVDTFFKKVLALYLSQEQKCVYTDRKFISSTKPTFPSPAFHSSKPYKMNVFSLAIRKIKAWKLRKYFLLIIVTGTFFYYYLAIHPFRLNYSSGTFLFEDCRCEVERWLACVISTAWITQEKLWKRSQYLRATDFC